MRADARLLRDLDRHSHHHRRRFSSPLLAPATDPWLVAQAAAVAATTAIPRSPRRYGHYPVSPLASVGFGAPLQSPVYLPASPYIDTTLGPHSIYIPHDPLHNGLRDREYQMALAGEQRERRLAMADWRGETRAREIHQVGQSGSKVVYWPSPISPLLKKEEAFGTGTPHIACVDFRADSSRTSTSLLQTGTQLQRLEEEAILDQAAVRAATAYTAARSPYLRAPEYGYPAGSPYIGEGMHRPGILSVRCSPASSCAVPDASFGGPLSG